MAGDRSECAAPSAEWERLETLSAPLLGWYDANRRRLPWREDVSPYRTWISEVMLQQTRVSAVIPYFERFVAALPDVPALAAVSDERLLKLWEGLGYYSRARNLRLAARCALERYGGELPRTAAELASLPGIGDYTAAAIASINYAEPVAAVDGNLLRVTARLCGCYADVTDARVRRAFAARLNAVIDRERPGAYNQAMMDLGATVCLPNGAPLCETCPARRFCAAYRQGLTEILPVRGAKKARRAEERTVIVHKKGDTIAVRTRSDTGLLASLTEFPNVLGSLDEAGTVITLTQWGLTAKLIEPIGTARHVFTHVEWQMKGYFVEVEGEGDGFRYVTREELDTLAIPSAFRYFTKIAHEKL